MTKVLVAMSGGVDSSVAAALLQREGHELLGVFMRNGVGGTRTRADAGRKACSRDEDERAAAAVARELGIPFRTCDLSGEFGELVEHFVAEYRRGRTPNPCLVCNRRHKFGRLSALAEELGFERVATGHYARVEKPEGRIHLLRGVDERKEQAYVLSHVPERALARALFPLGGLAKERVRVLAHEFGLSSQDTPESQEICFVPSGDYRDLLRMRGVALRAGKLVDSGGRVLGEHAGIEHFTVGQRRGLGIAHREPLYVIAIHPRSGEVVVGPRSELGRTRFAISEMNWIGREPLGPGCELPCTLQIRANQRPRAGRVQAGTDGILRAIFEDSVSAITPGQGAALFHGSRCLGGGWVELEGEGGLSPSAAGGA